MLALQCNWTSFRVVHPEVVHFPPKAKHKISLLFGFLFTVSLPSQKFAFLRTLRDVGESVHVG